MFLDLFTISPKLKVLRIIQYKRNSETIPKVTLITAILGLIIPLLGVVAYVFINSIIGIPVLALFLGGIMLIAA